MNAIDVGQTVLWGAAATVVLTVAMGIAQAMRWSRIGLPFLLGSVVTPSRERASAVGTAMHVVAGLVMAFPYALLFEAWGRSGPALGAAVGLLHGLFTAAVVLPTLPSFHPRMAGESQGPTPTRQLQPPGWLGLNYGRRSLATTLVAHLLYGLVLGAFYTPS